MITDLIFNIVAGILTAIFAFMPQVTIASIPVIGGSVSSVLTSMVETWNAFLITFPYAQIGWNVFLTVILPFEILMLVIKFLLGARAPGQHKS